MDKKEKKRRKAHKLKRKEERVKKQIIRIFNHEYMKYGLGKTI